MASSELDYVCKDLVSNEFPFTSPPFWEILLNSVHSPSLVAAPGLQSSLLNPVLGLDPFYPPLLTNGLHQVSPPLASPQDSTFPDGRTLSSNHGISNGRDQVQDLSMEHSPGPRDALQTLDKPN